MPVFLGFPCGSAHNESAHNAGDLGSIPGLGRSPGEGTGYPLQYSGLENSMYSIVHGVTESDTTLHFRHKQWNFVKTQRRENMDIKILLCLSIHYLITKNFLILNKRTKEG